MYLLFSTQLLHLYRYFACKVLETGVHGSSTKNLLFTRSLISCFYFDLSKTLTNQKVAKAGDRKFPTTYAHTMFLTWLGTIAKVNSLCGLHVQEMRRTYICSYLLIL